VGGTSAIQATGDETDHEHSRAEDTARVPWPPLAGKADGLGVAAAAHRAGDGATLVLVAVDPQPLEEVSALSRRSASRCVRR
jgi:hypothetical protein